MSIDETAARLLLTHRKAAFAYILAIVRDHHLAEDLYQEVSMVVLRRWEDFGEVKDFWALTREIARRQSLAALRKRGKAPLLLSHEALDVVDQGFEEIRDEVADREEALSHCVSDLPEAWRQIVRLRYWLEMSIRDVAVQVERSENSVSVTLNRVRKRLADCVTHRLRPEGA